MPIQDSEEGDAAMEQDVQVVARADPALQESLQSEVVPDPMEGEQTWPTDEELRQAEGTVERHRSLRTYSGFVVSYPRCVENEKLGWYDKSSARLPNKHVAQLYKLLILYALSLIAENCLRKG